MGVIWTWMLHPTPKPTIWQFQPLRNGRKNAKHPSSGGVPIPMTRRRLLWIGLPMALGLLVTTAAMPSCSGMVVD